MLFRSEEDVVPDLAISEARVGLYNCPTCKGSNQSYHERLLPRLPTRESMLPDIFEVHNHPQWLFRRAFVFLFDNTKENLAARKSWARKLKVPNEYQTVAELLCAGQYELLPGNIYSFVIMLHIC